MKKTNVLIIADKEDVKFLDTAARSEHWNLYWKIIDYNQLHKAIEGIRKSVDENEVDFILYSRNDQVAKKISIGSIHKRLKLGYSSFSGIDDKFRVEQMKTCFNDFLKIGVNLDFELPKLKAVSNHKSKKGAGTFSVIFDTEQLGGVRFGLPRVLNLLKRYGIEATFFVTNLMKRVYPNILEIISSQGHEIGIHGRFHEFLSNYNTEKQEKEIREMLKDFGNYPIYGANFMGRMNNETISALIANNIKYFVHPLLHDYALFGFLKLPTYPFLFSHMGEKIYIIPVSVETYGRSWRRIKWMLDSAISEALKTKFKHITILCHPFRDGNLQHIQITEKLLQYLSGRGWKSIHLKELVNILDTNKEHLSEADVVELFRLKKIKVSLPRTKQDLISMLPENLIRIYTKISKSHTIF